uniref:tRNA (carboxymethyluridine(34)-5-O)-methyltransferase n=1 Tax=Eptatretus burgeri TaxID=7764 RepID=A0A8C4NFD8_EPTBU
MVVGEGEGERPKLTKAQKKVLRKQQKAKLTLLRHEGVPLVTHITEHLVIANGGLGNGMSRELLTSILQPFGHLLVLHMLPGKPYAFASFSSSADAERVYRSLNGFTVSGTARHITLYLGFVEQVLCLQEDPSSLPPGLLLIPNFVSEEYEQELLNFLAWDEAEEIQDKRVLKHRRVKHFGFEFCYEDNSVNKANPLPGGIPSLCDEMISNCLVAGYIQHRPDQLTVNRYEPGQGIPPHVDTHSAFEDGIVSLSLGSQVVMDFRHPCGTRVPVFLPARSLLVMSGESRYLWSHGITPRKFDIISNRLQDGGPTLANRGMRISFSFRKVCWQPCHCCRFDLGLTYTRNTDRRISATQGTPPWPHVAAFVRGLPDAALLLDIGCGNGKYLSANRGLAMIGCDRSMPLTEICHQRGFQVLVCDALSLPVRSTSFDACLSIAVVHHLSTAREQRVPGGMARVLRPGGQGLVYVWALEQEYMHVRSKYLQQKQQDAQCTNGSMVPSAGLLSVHKNRMPFSSQDVLVPWHLKTQEKQNASFAGSSLSAPDQRSVHHRFYHVFRKGELECLCRRVPGIHVIETYYDQGNWCVIFEKMCHPSSTVL